jgi:hypothetical protein
VVFDSNGICRVRGFAFHELWQDNTEHGSDKRF